VRLARKIRTLIAVYKTFGLWELLRLVLRKIKPTLNFTKHTTNPHPAITLTNFGEIESFLKEISLKFTVGNRGIFQDCVNALDARAHRRGFFDSKYDMGNLALYSLYLCLENLDKTTILETGVAAGKSTSFILEYLDVNAKEIKLVSTDISGNIGELIPENLKKRWTFEKIGIRAKRDFLSIVHKYNDISVFIHDSNHSEEWEIFEVTSVIENCPNLSIIIVDDVQDNVIHFLSGLNWNIRLLREETKRSLLAIKG
jgi:predicted O-methyltransferase YrrM